LNRITENIIGAAIDVHRAQLFSYLKLSGSKVGLLINFNEKLLKNGIRRLVNEYLDSP
jgi:GxxExxY protein